MQEQPDRNNAGMIAELADASRTKRLGELIADFLEAGDVVALEGDLGTGKTTLARAIISKLSGETEAPSPTFTLAQTYSATIRGREIEIWHFDLYRLKRAEEAYDLAIEDAFAEGISIIEWPSRLGNLLPHDCLWIALSMAGGDGRHVELSGPARWRKPIHSIQRDMRA